MSITLTSEGIMFPGELVQRDAENPDSSKPIFVGFFKNDISVVGDPDFYNYVWYEGIPAFHQLTWTKMPLNQATIDTHNGFNGNINSFYYECKVAGWYWISSKIGYDSYAWLYYVSSAIAINSNRVAEGGSYGCYDSENGRYGASRRYSSNFSRLIYLNVGDKVSLYAWADSYSTYYPGVLHAFLNINFVRA
jgi:hypothetical protein